MRAAHFLLLCPSLFVTAHAGAAEQTRIRDPETGMLAWKKIDNGFSLELIQLMPQYVAAVYASRNLPPAVVDSMRDYCVFGSVAQNQSGGLLDYRVADWRAVTPDGAQHPLKTKPEWVAEWQALGADFGWSILPAAMTFDTGDWAQGFTTVRLPPGAQFDLNYSWSHHGKRYSGKLESLVCAPSAPPALP